MFGGNLTSGEGAEWAKQDITANMSPDQIRLNLTRQKEIENRVLARKKRVYEKGGYNKDQLGEYGVDVQQGADVFPGGITLDEINAEIERRKKGK
jgi:hypothetical protein